MAIIEQIGETMPVNSVADDLTRDYFTSLAEKHQITPPLEPCELKALVGLYSEHEPSDDTDSELRFGILSSPIIIETRRGTYREPIVERALILNGLLREAKGRR